MTTSATDPAIVELASRVRVTVDEQNLKNYCPATVRLTLRNGNALSETREFLRGGTECPLKDDELADKLASCLEAGGYGRNRGLAERVWNSVMNLDKKPGVGMWMEELTNLFGLCKEPSLQGSNA